MKASLHNLRLFAARALENTIFLRRSAPYQESNKTYQNRLIGENILRKATQLVNDLNAARDNGGVLPSKIGKLFNKDS